MKKMMVLLGVMLSLGTGLVSAAPLPADGSVYTLHTEGKADRTIDTVLMVPLRDVAEHLGFTVTWDKGKTVVDTGKFHTTVTIGEDTYVITPDKKGEAAQTLSLGIPPALKNNVTYVPVTFFRPLLGDDAAVIEVKDGTLSLFEKAPVADTDKENQEKQEETEKSTTLANPFEDFDTLGEAETSAGFSLTLPKTDSYDETAYRAIKGELVEVIYAKEGTEQMRIRKGSDAGDVSGDYSTYPTIKTIVVDGIAVRMKGQSNLMNLATWENGGYSYSIHTDRAVTIGDMMNLVRAVK